jgi:signal transduction histidine kinase
MKYENLISQVQELELRTQIAETQAAHASKEHLLAVQKLAKVEAEMHTLQTLNLGLFSTLESAEIYKTVCESLVYNLHWQAAYFIDLKAGRLIIHGSVNSSQGNLEHLKSHLVTSAYFTEAYSHKNTISTYLLQDRISIFFRSIFKADEVVALPIIFTESMFGYLFLTAASVREAPDMDFLSTLAAQIAQVLQNSQNYHDLEHQNAKLRQLDDLKDSFISVTSHQLRTPLSIVKWILALLQSDKEISKLPQQLNFINEAYESNERLIHVVNDLLNVSRIQEGRLPYYPQLTDLKDTLDDFIYDLNKTCLSHKLTLEEKIPAKLPLVELDSLLFKEAIQSLLNNAVDYNYPGGKVSLIVENVEDINIYIINTTEHGISDDEMLKIFDQFYRSPEAIKIQPSGNGLGLFLARAIIREHGGDITCESHNYQVSFKVVLPKKHHQSREDPNNA